MDKFFTIEISKISEEFKETIKKISVFSVYAEVCFWSWFVVAALAVWEPANEPLEIKSVTRSGRCPTEPVERHGETPAAAIAETIFFFH